MSLRLFYGDESRARRRAAVASSRLDAVLGQGLVDHKEELERRLRLHQVPRGAAGLQAIPVGDQVVREDDGTRVHSSGRCIAMCDSYSTLSL